MSDILNEILNNGINCYQQILDGKSTKYEIALDAKDLIEPTPDNVEQNSKKPKYPVRRSLKI